MPLQEAGKTKKNMTLSRLAAALIKVPVSVRLPVELAEYVRSQPNRNQWLIAAIAKLEEEKQSQNAS